MNEKPLMTMPDAAKRLNMSSRWVRQQIAEKQLPAVRFGRSVRLDPVDVETFARQHRQPADA